MAPQKNTQNTNNQSGPRPTNQNLSRGQTSANPVVIDDENDTMPPPLDNENQDAARHTSVPQPRSGAYQQQAPTPAGGAEHIAPTPFRMQCPHPAAVTPVQNQHPGACQQHASSSNRPGATAQNPICLDDTPATPKAARRRSTEQVDLHQPGGWKRRVYKWYAEGKVAEQRREQEEQDAKHREAALARKEEVNALKKKSAEARKHLMAMKKAEKDKLVEDEKENVPPKDGAQRDAAEEEDDEDEDMEEVSDIEAELLKDCAPTVEKDEEEDEEDEEDEDMEEVSDIEAELLKDCAPTTEEDKEEEEEEEEDEEIDLEAEMCNLEGF